MKYDFHCNQCEVTTEVEKSVDKYNEVGYCIYCGSVVSRLLPTRFYFHGGKRVDPYYDQGLGCVVKDTKHRDQIAKSKGVTEVGNESMDKFSKKLKTEKDKKWAHGWDKIDTQL